MKVLLSSLAILLSLSSAHSACLKDFDTIQKSEYLAKITPSYQIEGAIISQEDQLYSGALLDSKTVLCCANSVSGKNPQDFYFLNNNEIPYKKQSLGDLLSKSLNLTLTESGKEQCSQMLTFEEILQRLSFGSCSQVERIIVHPSYNSDSYKKSLNTKTIIDSLDKIQEISTNQYLSALDNTLPDIQSSFLEEMKTITNLAILKLKEPVSPGLDFLKITENLFFPNAVQGNIYTSVGHANVFYDSIMKSFAFTNKDKTIQFLSRGIVRHPTLQLQSGHFYSTVNRQLGVSVEDYPYGHFTHVQELEGQCLPGNSGGPLLREKQDGTAEIMGIFAGGFIFSPQSSEQEYKTYEMALDSELKKHNKSFVQCYNIFTAVAPHAEWIKSHMESTATTTTTAKSKRDMKKDKKKDKKQKKTKK